MNLEFKKRVPTSVRELIENTLQRIQNTPHTRPEWYAARLQEIYLMGFAHGKKTVKEQSEE